MTDGTTGEDRILLFSGDDVGNGLGGDDTIDGGTGNDQAFGGAGNDRLIAGPASDPGKDTLWGGIGDDLLECGPGDFGDLADGGAGIDHITLTYFGFVVPGTAFFVTLSPAFFVFAGGAPAISVQNVERISITTADGNDFLQGGAFDDVLIARDGFDTLIGGGGNDTLNAGAGDYSVDGGADIDYLAVDLRAETVGFTLTLTNSGDADVTGAGNADGIEQLLAIGGTGGDSLTGNALDDSLNGWDGNDILTGNDGVDALTGYFGNDTIYAGSGNDRIDPGNGDDVARAGSGDDLIREQVFEVGADKLWGEAGNDQIEASQGDDVAYGGAGNDFLELGSGSDRGYGGKGNDFIRDDLGAPYGNDSLYGGAGNDTLIASGTGGIDILRGGRGDDTIIGGDDVHGGGGSDIFNTSGSNIESRVIVTGLAGGIFTVSFDGVVGITAASIERFVIFGGQVGDTLSGGAGDDTISGNGGFTFTNPQPLLETDTLDGGAGDDRLIGRDGRDDITGGKGADTCVFETITDSGALAADAEILRGFKGGTDVIDVSGIDADPGTPSVNDAVALVGAFTGAAGQAVLTSLTATRHLPELDRDGNGVADMAIDIRGDAPLAGDLLL